MRKLIFVLVFRNWKHRFYFVFECQIPIRSIFFFPFFNSKTKGRQLLLQLWLPLAYFILKILAWDNQTKNSTEISRNPIDSRGEGIEVANIDTPIGRAFGAALKASGFGRVHVRTKNRNTHFPCPLGTFSNSSTEGQQGCTQCTPGKYVYYLFLSVSALRWLSTVLDGVELKRVNGECCLCMTPRRFHFLTVEPASFLNLVSDTTKGWHLNQRHAMKDCSLEYTVKLSPPCNHIMNIMKVLS